MKTVLKADRIGKSYSRKTAPGAAFRSMLLKGRTQDSDPFWAVRDVSFSLGQGESVGIIGRNGSGKSTLLQVLCGITPPTEGEVRVDGRVAGLLELGAGFDPEFTGAENVFLNAALLGLTRSEVGSRFDEIAAFADIGRFLDEPVRTYSSGMFVRLAFAVAVHVSPDVLVIDEALAVGDARFSAKCIKKIKSLRELGTTLLFVSHDVGIVRTLCDRAIWLDSGRVAQQGDVFGVTSRYMEFMFSDDVKQVHAEALGSSSKDPPQDHDPVKTQPEPINRWGFKVGSVVSVDMYSAGQVNPAVIDYGATVRVEMEIEVPPGFDSSQLSAAFSIKDLKGTDLMVCTTHDENAGLFGSIAGKARVVFEFVNRLTEGKYLLVAALEDRGSQAISYFDYIEGAHYFSVVSRVRRFGVFNVPVAVSVE
jgi:lipopolysaccharide transport system ATP-binding protein